MPRVPCYWTRKLELDLVEFIRERDFIWKPVGNTNHHIQQKYKAYAEFAAKLGRGFTARSVRDRWVNIRSTFNHNLRRVEKSKKTAQTQAEIYVPCWPLWKPLQFLRNVPKKEEAHNYEGYTTQSEFGNNMLVKEELQSDVDDNTLLEIRQRGQRTDRPRRKSDVHHIKGHVGPKKTKCKRVIDDLVKAMKPLCNATEQCEYQRYWFFGRHVTEMLNAMRKEDAECASRDIMTLLESYSEFNVT